MMSRTSSSSASTAPIIAVAKGARPTESSARRYRAGSRVSTWVVTRPDAERAVTETCVPVGPAICASSAAKLAPTGRPSTPSKRSPWRSPAFAAGATSAAIVGQGASESMLKPSAKRGEIGALARW